MLYVGLMRTLVYGRVHLVAALILCTHALRAADAPTAEALFRAGREASDRGNYKIACDRFRESYRLDPAAGTLLNIASCLESLGELANAWETYRHVAESLAPDDDRLELVQSRAAALDERLPRVTLHIGAAKLHTVYRDGELLTPATFDVPLPLDPGEHRFVVRGERRGTREYVVVLRERDRVALRLEPGELTPPTREPSPRSVRFTPQQASSREQLGYLLLGAGAAGLATATITLGLYLNAASTVHGNHCPTTNTCDDTGLKAAANADTLGTATWAAGVTGLLALSGGVALLIIDKKSEKRFPRLALSPGFRGVSAMLRF